MKIGTRIPPVGGEMGFDAFCRWLAENGFGSVDTSALTAEIKQTTDAAGLVIGTCDIGHVRETLSADESVRAEGVKNLKEQLSETASLGGKLLFCVLLPEDASLGRQKNFDIWKETWPEILSHADSLGLKFALEWWPGSGPAYPALACTPEMWRAMLKVTDSPALGMCYDPSHLARIQIDWMRALDEIGERVVHVHAKDTEILPERLYEQGILGASFGVDMGFSEGWWRYCIPGDGVVDWGKVVARMEHFNFDGVFSIELEDYRYWKDGEAQKAGLLAAKKHLDPIVR